MDNSSHADVGTSRARRLLCFAVLFIGNTFASCCISLLGPFFPVEAAKKGASKTVVGFIFSCPELVVFLTSPLFGALLSEISPRFMCVSGLWVFSSCVILFGWLSKSPPGWIFIGLCFATRVVEALGTASYMTSCLTIAAGLFPDRKPTIYSLLEIGVTVGFAVGPAIGGFLFECGGYAMPFWTLGGCLFIVGVATLIFLQQNEHHEHSQVSPQSTFLLLRSPLVSLGVLCLTCNCYVFTVWVPGFAQHLQQFGLKTSTIGLLFLTLPLTYITVSLIFSFLIPPKIPDIPIILTSLSALSVAMLLYGPAPFLTFLPRALWLQIFSTVCMGFFTLFVYIGAISCIFTGIR
ncbi:MFS-type transporter SLC18B1-like [Haliotis rufescens]|uniref:MFS-type transporter SLC18B1-like n=1 Tax=Haliotis rufescens TaxID=6454 RepID=UPI00201FB379|nr:MFS-type transporter SLC18B1-like [Haliotis rufescens]